MGFFDQFASRSKTNRHNSQIKPISAPGSALQKAPNVRSIEELEQQMAREAQQEAQLLQTRPYQPISVRLRRTCSRLVWTTVLLGIPIGAIALINLPYAPIRRPIAEKAPLLLLPSYISMDGNFRQAAAALQESKQLIDQATTSADLERGEETLKQAKASLDQLPTSVWSELPDTSHIWSWYDWRMTALSLSNARAEVGRLEGKLFQEKNAQTALIKAEHALGDATQQYQEAQTSLEKQAALLVWQDALDQLQQIPAATLAGKTAQQRLQAAQRDFEANSRSLGGNQQSLVLITAARDFAWQAAQAAQNPPHTVAQWQQAINLWQQAINRLEQISTNDLVGYQTAQKLLATYRNNLEVLKVRQQAEVEATAAMQQAKEQIANLLKITPESAKADRTYMVSQLQRIVNQLEKISNGTTAYSEAQDLLKSARTKLKQLEQP
jgi:hypothetical protein